MSNKEITPIPLSKLLYSVKEHQLFVPVLTAVLVLFFTTLLYAYYKLLRRRADTILFVGLANSGKTTIFTKLINPANRWTSYTSVKQNIFSDYLCADGKRIKLIDYPGSEAFRKILSQNWFSQNREQLKCLIFTIDSANFNKKDVAEFLYDVLYELKGKVPVLVACNKQDIGHAKSGQLIQKSIEQEFGLINISREAALSSIEGESEKRLLTDTGREFKWTDLKGNNRPKDFVECSTEEGDDKTGAEQEFTLAPLRKWIEEI